MSDQKWKNVVLSGVWGRSPQKLKKKLVFPYILRDFLGIRVGIFRVSVRRRGERVECGTFRVPHGFGLHAGHGA